MLMAGSTHHDSFRGIAQEHVAQEKQHGILKSVITKVIDLFLNWKFTLAFALNQSGSLLYYVLLGATGKWDPKQYDRRLNIPSRALNGCTHLQCDYSTIYSTNRPAARRENKRKSTL
mmetsp:Transcript_15136/g.26642  ORF Transcript_15136/g.26642 Transcript_15136/m.26642 type:complete len:117 (+) Transcript_15136:4119-4469(+)